MAKTNNRNIVKHKVAKVPNDDKTYGVLCVNRRAKRFETAAQLRWRRALRLIQRHATTNARSTLRWFRHAAPHNLIHLLSQNMLQMRRDFARRSSADTRPNKDKQQPSNRYFAYVSPALVRIGLMTTKHILKTFVALFNTPQCRSELQRNSTGQHTIVSHQS